MLMIRMARFGAKKKPFYRIVVIEKQKARNGPSLEVVGHYDPLSNPARVDLNYERIRHWRSVGAQMSDTVSGLLAKHPAPAAAEPSA